MNQTTPATTPFICALCFLLAFLQLIGCSGSAGGVNVWDATKSEDIAALETFSRAGGNVNVQDFSGETPLHYALLKKKRKSYETLLELGADPNIQANDGRVVVNWASAEEDSWWLEQALDHGGNPNYYNDIAGAHSRGTPLKFAISEGSSRNIELLAAHGADLNHIDEFHEIPLVYAISSGRFDVVLHLLEAGADYELRSSDRDSFVNWIRRTDLKHPAAKGKEDEIVAVFEWLKAKGVDLENPVER